MFHSGKIVVVSAHISILSVREREESRFNMQKTLEQLMLYSLLVMDGGYYASRVQVGMACTGPGTVQSPYRWSTFRGHLDITSPIYRTRSYNEFNFRECSVMVPEPANADSVSLVLRY